MNIPALFLIAVGLLLMWAAIKNVSPVQTVKDVLTGKHG